MNFLLDQDVPERVGDVLQREGHSVAKLRELLPINTTDEFLLTYAHDDELILVTCNRDDFLNLAGLTAHFGIVILIRRHTRLAECSAILRLVRTAHESGLARNINFA